MPVIYLRHPVHGAKVAISDMEAENDMQNGWEQFDPTVPNAVSDNPTDEAAPEPINALQPRKRGRRPKDAAQE